jgi:hypothetical protein
MQFRAFFAERDRSRASALMAAIPAAYGHCSFIFPYDNAEVLEVFATYILNSGENIDKAMGTLLLDPQGWFYRGANGEGVPVDHVIGFTRRFPRIDIILNLNSRTYRLQHGAGHVVRTPREVLRSLNKQYWLVGEAYYGGCSFLLAVGRNYPIGEHRKVGLHSIDSPEGQYILDRAEGGRQGGLFDAVI